MPGGEGPLSGILFEVALHDVELGIEVVDEMENQRLERHRDFRCAKLWLALVTDDEVFQLKEHLLWKVIDRVADIADQVASEQGVADLITPLFERLIAEFNKMSTYYLRKEGVKIQKITLSGGAAKLPGLADYLSKKLSTQVSLGDPFARIAYPPNLETVIKGDLSTSLAFAVGLAKREF